MENKQKDNFDKQEEILKRVDNIEEFQELNEDSNDRTVFLEKSYSMFQQADNLVFYQIKGLYEDEEETKFKSKLSLVNKPPKLTFLDANDNEVEFDLTKDLADKLYDNLRDVNIAYKGLSKSSNKNYYGLKDYYEKNKIRILITLGVLMVFIVYLISIFR